MLLQKKFLYPFILFLVLAFYCLYIGRNGYEQWDSGFISGLSWRILNGELMYTDFIYTKPPVTPYFASIFMYLLPQEGQFYYIRCINLLLFAVQVSLTVFAIQNIYNLKKLNFNLWALITVGFIVSWLNFSPYPWYTQDGLLFASVALFIKSKYKGTAVLPLFFIAFFAMLSALSKQSFYLIPPLFVAWMFVDYGFKKALWFAGCLSFLLGIFILLVTRLTTLPQFLADITGQAHFHDLYYTCIYGYAHKNLKLYILIGLVTILLGTDYKAIKETRFAVLFKWFIICQALAGVVLLAIGKAGLGSIIAFNSCATGLVYNYFILKKEFKYLFPLAAILVIAWSSSVSWGYPYPILYATGIMLTFIILMQDSLLSINPKWLVLTGVVLCLLAISYNKKPYRQSNITQLTYNLGAVSPKLKYLMTDKKTFDEHYQLKQLVKKYGAPYIVTTAYSGAHYFFNDLNPISADWMLNSETSFRLDKMLAEAAASNGYIFLEKDFNLQGVDQKTFSSFSQYIKDNCTPLEKCTYFTVYDTKQLRNKLP